MTGVATAVKLKNTPGDGPSANGPSQRPEGRRRFLRVPAVTPLRPARRKEHEPVSDLDALLTPDERAVLKALYRWEQYEPYPISPVPDLLLIASLFRSGANVRVALPGLLKQGLVRQPESLVSRHGRWHWEDGLVIQATVHNAQGVQTFSVYVNSEPIGQERHAIGSVVKQQPNCHALTDTGFQLARRLFKATDGIQWPKKNVRLRVLAEIVTGNKRQARERKDEWRKRRALLPEPTGKSKTHSQANVYDAGQVMIALTEDGQVLVTDFPRIRAQLEKLDDDLKEPT